MIGKFRNSVMNSEKNKDMALVVLLIFMLLFLRFDNKLFIQLSFVTAIIGVVLPSVLTPLSMCWYGLSEVLGTVVSRIVLSIVFFCIITPIGIVRRWFSKKRLLTEKWKNGTDSVFTFTNKIFTDADISKPY